MSHKFQNELACRLYELSLNGQHDDSLGDTVDFDWYALFLQERAIIREDNYGSVAVTHFETIEATEEAWDDLVEDWGIFLDSQVQLEYDYEDVYPDNDSYLDSDLYDFEF